MFTRHLIAAAALMATTFAAQADVITVASTSPPAANTSNVDSGAELYLVRGVEGLYMVASRTISQPADAGVDVLPVPGDTVQDVNPTPDAADTPAPGATLPVANADPVVNADVPEPTSIALMLAGVLGAAGFTRARKQG